MRIANSFFPEILIINVSRLEIINKVAKFPFQRRQSTAVLFSSCKKTLSWRPIRHDDWSLTSLPGSSEKNKSREFEIED